MARPPSPPPPQRRGPDWDRLYRTAEAQAGHFTTRQAGEAGYSPQLLARYLGNRRVRRVRRGVYRLRHFPPAAHEGLVAAWLWSDRIGVISHQTALALHDPAAPSAGAVHLTVPLSWRRRRLRLPPGVVLHHADLPDRERTRIGAVVATTAARTRRDCRETAAPARGPTQFLCLISAGRMLEVMSPGEARRHLAGYRALTAELRRKGQLLGCNRLQPAETAATVRVRGGRVKVADGPFAETKELIGGYFLITARDRAEAVAVAARFPGAQIGSVEVRPIADDPQTLRALGLPVESAVDRSAPPSSSGREERP